MTIFEELCRHYNQAPDRRGEVYIQCPFCGSQSSRKHVKCSFSAKGFFCFVCGKGVSLRIMAAHIGLTAGAAMPQQPHLKPTPKPAPSWLARPETYLERYEAHPARYTLWDAYKLLPRAVIEQKRLGVGVLPASRCKHERLIVPVLVGSRVVGLRGRQLDCECGKWLQAGGTQLGQMPLYNQDALTSGQVVLIVENPVDALMATAYTPYVGVATYTVTYWRDGWTDTLRAARPELVVVAYDNDVVGNGGAKRRAEFVAEWRAKHRVVPEPRGPMLANLLIKAGLPATLYDWGDKPNKYDFGSLLQETVVEGRKKAQICPQEALGRTFYTEQVF